MVTGRRLKAALSATSSAGTGAGWQGAGRALLFRCTLAGGPSRRTRGRRSSRSGAARHSRPAIGGIAPLCVTAAARPVGRSGPAWPRRSHGRAGASAVPGTARPARCQTPRCLRPRRCTDTPGRHRTAPPARPTRCMTRPVRRSGPVYLALLCRNGRGQSPPQLRRPSDSHGATGLLFCLSRLKQTCIYFC